MVTQLAPLEPPSIEGALLDADMLREWVLQVVREEQLALGLTVEVAAPPVHVASPAPQVAVYPEITVEPADLGELGASLTRIERLLTELVTLIAKPTTTKVARDADKLITEVVTSR